MNDLIKKFKALLAYAERNTCLHEETYRGGAIWEICANCGMKWADDEGGKPKNAHDWPKEIAGAQKALDEQLTLLGSDVYVLLADGDGTMRSTDEPFGVAVTTESEAKRFVKEGKVGYSHSYEKVRIFNNKDQAILWKYPEHKNEECAVAEKCNPSKTLAELAATIQLKK